MSGPDGSQYMRVFNPLLLQAGEIIVGIDVSRLALTTGDGQISSKVGRDTNASPGREACELTQAAPTPLCLITRHALDTPYPPNTPRFAPEQRIHVPQKDLIAN